MNDLPTVRIATPNEEESVMELCRELYGENGLFTFDEGLVRAMVRRALLGHGAIIGVIGDPGQLQAAIFLLVGNFWYSHDLHLEELFSYVRPECRKSTNAKGLIEFAKRCADGTGLKLVIGIISNERTEAKVKLYRRQLGDPAGAFFVHGSGPVVPELPDMKDAN